MQLRAQLSLHEMRLYLKKWMVAYVSMKCDRSLVPCAGCAGRRVFSTRNVPQTAFDELCPDHDPQVGIPPGTSIPHPATGPVRCSTVSTPTRPHPPVPLGK